MEFSPGVTEAATKVGVTVNVGVMVRVGLGVTVAVASAVAVSVGGDGVAVMVAVAGGNINGTMPRTFAGKTPGTKYKTPPIASNNINEMKAKRVNAERRLRARSFCRFRGETNGWSSGD